MPGGTATEYFIVTAIASDTSLTVAAVALYTASGQTATRASNQRVWTGYVADRKYYRPQGTSLITGPARLIDATLVDLNTFLSFRLYQTGVFKRPAETDIVRVQAMLATSFLSTTLFDLGFVATASGVAMDAVDYTGQRPNDVLNDCAQASGRNFFVYYNEAQGKYGLWYDFDYSANYATTMRLSNVLADVDNALTFAPKLDAVLTRDPSRVISGVLMPFSGGSVYSSRIATSYVYGYRDGSAPSVNVKTAAKATARATRYLNDNATEDDRIVVTVQVPAAHVNDWREGQLGYVKFSHLPGYEAFKQVRAVNRQVAQDELTDALYNIRYEFSPIPYVYSGTIDVLCDSGTPAWTSGVAPRTATGF